ncbi:glyoxalase [Haloferula helveola]|uniref:Glyoxalase n=1 Tax=Haloferula helveola TaxID=490095 RepID=A0ABM7RCN4_9BACT|nr:glyoxalase [Haloferula helveola]
MDPMIGGFSISLTVADGKAALDLYRRALEAEELYRMALPEHMGGGIAHAEFKVGEQILYLSEAYPDWSAEAMDEDQVASCLFGVNVADCDAAFSKAVAEGMKTLSEPADQPWGWRTAIVLDPFGYRWNIRQLIEEISPEELERRFKAMMEG